MSHPTPGASPIAVSPIAAYFLDVGQGDCTFVVPPPVEAAPVLFDCADAYVADRFVRDHGIRKLTAVVVSHLDRDHIRGLLPFLRGFFDRGGEVETLYVGVDRPADKLGDEALALIEQALTWEKEGRVSICPPWRDGAVREVAAGTDWRIEIVLPVYAALLDVRVQGREKPNPSSAVLRITRGSAAVLIGGDAPLASWDRLEPARLPAAVFRAPHHGGAIAEGKPQLTLNDLYDQVGASVTVISAGTNNPHSHPKPEHVSAARREGSCRVVCTQLTAQCDSDPTRRRPHALRQATGVEPPYRHRVAKGDPKRYRPTTEVPCGGTSVAWIEADGKIAFEPTSTHDAFVDQLDHPLCV